MKKYLILLLITVACFKSFAQQSAAKLLGYVTDENGQAVPFATLRFMPTDTASKAVAERISAEDGSFVMDLPVGNRYYLIATGASYTPTKEWVEISDSALHITLYKKTEQLETVTVKATVPLVTRKIDRVVMNVQDNALVAGKNSMEVMEMAPGLFVDRSGSISINGNSGVRVMVNGVLLQLSGDDLTSYLNNLRASDIQSIEIIAHPSAEYDAEGTGGIINIILKKQRTAGLTGNLSAGYSIGRYPGNDQGLQMNYHNNKLTLTGNYSHYQQKAFNDIHQSRNFPNDGLYAASNLIINRYNGHNVRLGATYDLSAGQYLALGYNGSFNHSSSVTHSTSDINYPALPADNYSSDGHFTDQNARNLHNFTFNYHLDTDTSGSQLEIKADYTMTHDNSSSLAISQDYDASGMATRDSSFRYGMPNRDKILTADIKYMQVFSPTTKLHFGGKYTGTEIDHINNFTRILDDNWTADPSLYYQYHYREHILAGFITLEAKVFNTEIQLGVRGENTKTSATLAAEQNSVNENSYFNLFPTVFVKRDLNEKGSNYLSLSYNKRIQRPYYNDLNPYISYLDNYTIETGNPNLKPQFSDNYEIGLTLANKYNLSIAYSDFKDEISQITHMSQDTALVEITRGNNGSTKRYSATLSIPLQITKWWKTNNTLQYRYEDIKTAGFAIKQPLVYLQTAQDFKISTTWSANLSAFYLNHAIEGNIFVGNISKVDIGVEKKLMDGNLKIRAGLTDLFLGRNITGTIKYDDNEIFLRQARQSRMFKLSLTYNFMKGKSFKTKKIESSSEEIQSRL
ncbi:Outer membrane receptor proteins, mostly Fe transport [Arachidicoccus rhizosphaerae]|uniref:Outer membrane receptor proteins, mostly Fe transport n=1 Tax=Arachidicoccus rhizosphaerae TaxID=551991 RepID=A0A1H4B4I4_9BACT|nr:outer membrane beta-barrel family protein [Arachidicoccus rhizosphaerae]SEA42976.1 Outer membrane receptor proteins, mostly Fe transport [Arachidicoccus rhizosphaerae]